MFCLVSAWQWTGDFQRGLPVFFHFTTIKETHKKKITYSIFHWIQGWPYDLKGWLQQPLGKKKQWRFQISRENFGTENHLQLFASCHFSPTSHQKHVEPTAGDHEVHVPGSIDSLYWWWSSHSFIGIYRAPTIGLLMTIPYYMEIMGVQTNRHEMLPIHRWFVTQGPFPPHTSSASFAAEINEVSSWFCRDSVLFLGEDQGQPVTIPRTASWAYEMTEKGTKWPGRWKRFWEALRSKNLLLGTCLKYFTDFGRKVPPPVERFPFCSRTCIFQPWRIFQWWHDSLQKANSLWCTCIQLYIYIYINIERERET